MTLDANAAPESCATAVDAIVNFFESLTPHTVAQLDALYAPRARFKDPFNDVTGLDAIRGIFAHMFATLDAPRFVVTGRIVERAQCFLTWEFHFAFRNFKQGQAQVILGGSHLVFAPDGKVLLHRDYWDAAEELYEKLPLVGALMRWFKRRANA